MIYIYIITVLLISFSCKAQQHVVGIYSNEDFKTNSNYYLKDLDNDFDKFLGTWKWEDGNTSLTFTLNKEIKYQLDATSMYKDMLVGEYRYVENGVEKANTLNRLDDISITGYSHKISGYSIISKISRPKCDDCSIDERRVRLFIGHQTVEDVDSNLVLRYVNENGVEKLEIRIFGGGPIMVQPDRTDPVELDIPLGEYTLIKQ